MAKTRVSELAKEFGMTSKELLGYLAEFKIPAKSASSSLESVYVNVVKKKLAPIMKEREEAIRAKQEAEEAEKRAAEEAERARAEAERKEAERRRAEERAQEQARREAEEARRAAEEAARREEEERRRAEEEKLRVKDTAPKSVPSFTSLLEQIAQQEEVLKAKKAEEQKAKEEAKAQKAERRAQQKARQAAPVQEPKVAVAPEPQPIQETVAPSPEKAAAQQKRGKKHRDRSEEGEERFGRNFDRERGQQKQGEGKRQKRRKRREEQAAQHAHEAMIQEAIANDQDVTKLDMVKVPQGSTVAELAELLGTSANDIIKRLFLLGTPLTMTQSMSDELIELVADDLGRDVKVMTKEEENSFTFYDDPSDLLPRAPVVTVMGHVDHGKTSTLDAIRHTGVAAGEAGGITQHIGASQVKVGDRLITFVDTPGHETFTAMRARGAKVTDIVVLVVAADDGVMPQTIESINHAKAAGVPIVVAVNKIDRDDANPDRVRSELSEYGVIPEEWGGENMFVEISAKQNIGIDELLETILLQADVLELKANPNTFASGYVLEAKLDRGRGTVATLLVNRGTLHVGDAIVAGMSYGRVRAMLDQHGNTVSEAGPSDAVEILGLQSVPAAGDEFRVFTDERDARNLADERALKARIEEQNKVKHITLENLFSSMEDAEVKELNLVVKADVQGSIEALSDALSKMDQSEVRINIIHSAVGAISETDVILADASNAIIIGFGVRPEAKARAAAERDNVQIRTYSVIYKAIEDIDAARIGMLNPTEVERDTGVAEVRDTFKVPKVGIAAGCMVVEGEIHRDDKVRLVRDGIVVYEGAFASMRRYKDDVRSVKAGYECGLGLENFQDFHIGDRIECYVVVEVARTE